MKFETLISVVLLVGISFSVVAQERSIGERAQYGKSSLSASSARALAVSYELQSTERTISGLQFDIKFDPNQHQVASLDNCLAGLPKTHKSEFSGCNVVEEKNMVRVIVMDLGKNRPLPMDTVLGWVEFDRVASGKRTSATIAAVEPKVTSVLYAGSDGNPLQAQVANGALRSSAIVIE